MTTIRRDGDEGMVVESTSGGSSATEPSTRGSDSTQDGLNAADLVVQSVVRAVLERRGVLDWN